MFALTEMIDNRTGEFSKYAWPGGYPIFYVCKDGGVLCADCVNKEVKQIVDATLEDGHSGWGLAGSDINYDDAELTCDYCNKGIEAAYI